MSNLEEKYVDSDASKEGDEELDPEIAKLNTKQLMQKIYLKLAKMEDTRIPKMKKKIADVEASQVATNSKVEALEDKDKELETNINENNERISKVEDATKQIEYTMKKSDSEIKAVTETIDQKAEKDAVDKIEKKVEEQNKTNTNRMKELETRFRKDMDEKIRKLEDEIKKINSSPLQLPRTVNLGPNTAAESLSIQQELQLAQRIPVSQRTPINRNDKPNYVTALSNPHEPSQRTKPNTTTQRPNRSDNKRFDPIITNSKEDIIKEAATNIGITKVSDMTIRKFSNLKEKLRYSKDSVWTGPDVVVFYCD